MSNSHISKKIHCATIAMAILAAALNASPAHAQSTMISACVNREGGIKIVPAGEDCRHGTLLQWRSGDPSPLPPPLPFPPPLPPPLPVPIPPPLPVPTPPPSTLAVQYVTGGIADGTSVARAYCPPGTKVTGGGGITAGAGMALQQSYPISDQTGVIAFGSTAIGWQVAADDWGFAQAFVVCVGL